MRPPAGVAVARHQPATCSPPGAPPPRAGHGAGRGGGRRAVVAAAALLVSLLWACGGDEASLRAFVRADPLQVGAVTMTDVSPGATSSPFRFVAPPGELLVVYFGYTQCPDVCPTTLASVSVALGDLGPDAARVRLVMATVDPERDTGDVLSAYLAHFTDRFAALRPADQAELQRAEEAFLASSSVTKDAAGEVEVSHTAQTYAVDSAGAVRAEWPFGTTADDYGHDLAALLRATSKERT